MKTIRFIPFPSPYHPSATSSSRPLPPNAPQPGPEIRSSLPEPEEWPTDYLYSHPNSYCEDCIQSGQYYDCDNCSVKTH